MAKELEEGTACRWELRSAGNYYDYKWEKGEKTRR